HLVPLVPAGLTPSDDNDAGDGGGVTVRTALRLAPPNAPLIVTDVDAPTETVLTVNVALVAPAATVTLAGTVAAPVLLLVSVTTAPPEGAALVSVTAPWDELPPTTLAGLSANEERLAAAGAPVTRSTVEAVRLSTAEI